MESKIKDVTPEDQMLQTIFESLSNFNIDERFNKIKNLINENNLNIIY